MGFWKTERGIGRDSWADEMDRCMDALQGMRATFVRSGDYTYRAEDSAGREITMREFADLVEFCTRGHIVADVRFPEADGDRPLSQLHDKGVETYSNRGQIHCPEMEGKEREKEVVQ